MTDWPSLLSLDDVQGWLRRSHFSTWLNIRAEAADADHVVMTFENRDDFMGNPDLGIVHGGILAALLDVGCSYTVIVPTGRSCVTASLHIDYHRPAHGKHFRIEARPVKRGRQLTVSDARITDEAGRLVASGRATLMQKGSG